MATFVGENSTKHVNKQLAQVTLSPKPSSPKQKTKQSLKILPTDLNQDSNVIAKVGDWNNAYKGKITKINEDGTYAILFDDGEKVEKIG